MDFKDFHDGLLSLSLVLFVFSLTFMIGSIALKPFIALEPQELSFIIVLCVINIIFSVYYTLEAIKTKKTFKLEDKHAIKFGKRIGIMTLIYSPHFFVFISLFIMGLHDIELLMVVLIAVIESLLLGLVFKEVYDLVFLNEADRKFELDENRTRYLNDKEKLNLDDF